MIWVGQCIQSINVSLTIKDFLMTRENNHNICNNISQKINKAKIERQS